MSTLVDPIDHYSGVVSIGWRGLGIFPLARVSASEVLNRPGVSQWKEYRADPKWSQCETLEDSVGSVRSTLRFQPLSVHTGREQASQTRKVRC
jgi:hypothetical protein